jgi:hypothetical protein
MELGRHQIATFHPSALRPDRVRRRPASLMAPRRRSSRRRGRMLLLSQPSSNAISSSQTGPCTWMICKTFWRISPALVAAMAAACEVTRRGSYGLPTCWFLIGTLTETCAAFHLRPKAACSAKLSSRWTTSALNASAISATESALVGKCPWRSTLAPPPEPPSRRLSAFTRSSSDGPANSEMRGGSCVPERATPPGVEPPRLRLTPRAPRHPQGPDARTIGGTRLGRPPSPYRDHASPAW